MGCFRGYFLARDKIELHVEQTGSVYKALGPDNFVKDSFTWWQKSGDDSPNRIVMSGSTRIIITNSQVHHLRFRRIYRLAEYSRSPSPFSESRALSR